MRNFIFNFLLSYVYIGGLIGFYEFKRKKRIYEVRKKEWWGGIEEELEGRGFD